MATEIRTFTFSPRVTSAGRPHVRVMGAPCWYRPDATVWEWIGASEDGQVYYWQEREKRLASRATDSREGT